MRDKSEEELISDGYLITKYDYNKRSRATKDGIVLFRCSSCQKYHLKTFFYRKTANLEEGIQAKCIACTKNACNQKLSVRGRIHRAKSDERVNFYIVNNCELWYYIGDTYERTFYKKYGSYQSANNAICEELSERILREKASF